MKIYVLLDLATILSTTVTEAQAAQSLSNAEVCIPDGSARKSLGASRKSLRHRGRRALGFASREHLTHRRSRRSLRPGENFESAWFVSRVDNAYNVDPAGPILLTRRQAPIEKARREAGAKGRYGVGYRIVMQMTSDSYSCAYVFKMVGCRPIDFRLTLAPL